MKKSTIAITATLLEADFLESLIEELASRRYDIGYASEKAQPGYKAIETSSVEAFVSGEAHIYHNDELINMPFTSSFLFTCIKPKNGEYRLALSQSLS